MMWIAGVKPLQVLEAYVAAVPALLFFGAFAARQQHALQPIAKDAPAGVRIDGRRVIAVVAILGAAIVADVAARLFFAAWLDRVPVIGLAVWLALLGTATVARPDWSGRGARLACRPGP